MLLCCQYFFGTNLINVLQPFTLRFPRADIHELLTPDLLHQAIKGTFKDHLVQWVEDYLELKHGPSKAESILDEIDRRYVESYICWNTLQPITALHWRHYFLVSEGSNRDGTSSSGPATTPRR